MPSRRSRCQRFSWLAIVASDAEAIAGDCKSVLGLRVLEAKARADVCAISPPTALVLLCNAKGFSPQKIQLPSGGVNDQASFLGHERGPQNGLDRSILFREKMKMAWRRIAQELYVHFGTDGHSSAYYES
ncbi:hypothetical protein [Bradyrhizobium rifense]|uniref:hypothetical protein n=1 Tax=Bradyrhizobium rifense TaxID=515499 RepID=UPI001653407F|nr:hypothetical protein [Bradyrhizobium rifense]